MIFRRSATARVPLSHMNAMGIPAIRTVRYRSRFRSGKTCLPAISAPPVPTWNTAGLLSWAMSHPRKPISRSRNEIAARGTIPGKGQSTPGRPDLYAVYEHPDEAVRATVFGNSTCRRGPKERDDPAKETDAASMGKHCIEPSRIDDVLCSRRAML